MAGCRDCSQCTESCVAALVKLPFRLALSLAFGWNIFLFTRRCPQCRHWMDKHHRLPGGRFAD